MARRQLDGRVRVGTHATSSGQDLGRPFAGDNQLRATCHKAGFTPDVRHMANSIATQLAMVGCGLGVTLVPSIAARSALPPTATYRPLANRAELVELSLVTRESPHEPLVREFLRLALTQPLPPAYHAH